MRRGKGFRFAGTVAVVAAALACAPAGAGAATFCVAPATGCTTDFSQTQLQMALSAAAGAATADTVKLGAATYSNGPFTINQSGADSIVGAGVGQTVLTAPIDPASQSILTSFGPVGPPVTPVITDLSIQVPSNAGEQDTGLDVSRVDVSRVNVTSLAAHSYGVRAGVVNLTDSTVALPTGPDQGYAAIVSSGAVTVSNSTLTGQRGAGQHSPNTTLTVTHSRIHATVGLITDGGNIAVDNTVINLGNEDYARGLMTENGNNSIDGRDITARHVTIVGGGANSQGLRVMAASLLMGAGRKQTVSVTLADSVISGPTIPIYRLARNNQSLVSTADVTVRYSNYDNTANSSTNDSNGGGAITETTPATNLAPGFVNAAGGDFRLAPTSPLIDIGDPAAGGSATDLAGAVRIQDGNHDGIARRDIGAFEADTTGPGTQITSGPSGTVTTNAASFAFATSPAEPTATFTCSLDSGAFAPCTDATGPDGVQSLTGLADGSHTFAVKATDDLGNTGTPDTRTFTVQTAKQPPKDTTPPQTKIKTKLAKTRKTKVKVAFSSSEADSTFTCKLDGGKAAACRSPKTFKGLKRRKHTLRVWATDAAGNRDATPAILRFKVLQAG